MQNICGVSVHPRYVGWFALRGVILFRDVLVPDLEQTPPLDVVPDDRLRVELLEQFNFHYNDWKFRDIVLAEASYCQELRDYLRARFTGTTTQGCHRVLQDAFSITNDLYVSERH